MMTIWGREPVAVATAVQLVLLAAVSLGLDLTVEQVAAIVAAVSAVLAVLVRSTVTAPANLTHASEENADV